MFLAVLVFRKSAEFSATIDRQAYSSSVSSGEINLAKNQEDGAGNAYPVIMPGDVHINEGPPDAGREDTYYGIGFDCLDDNFSKYCADNIQLSVSARN